MVKYYRKDVTVSDLWVTSHDKLSDFYASSWQRGETPVPMFIVRLLLLVLSIAILSWALHDMSSPYWLLYLTNWGLLLIVTTNLSGFLVSSIAVFKKLPDMSDLPWYVSMYWLLFNVTVCVSILVTALYWILIYDANANPEGNLNKPVFLLDVSTHAINSCMMMVELLASRTPVRLLHFYQPLGVGLWYAAFTAIYFAVGGTDMNGNPFIYEVLDWRQGKRAGVIIGASSGGVIIIYMLLWILALCRDSLSIGLLRTTSRDLPLAPPDVHTVNTV